MANCYLDLEDYPRAISMTEEAIPLLKANNDQGGLSRAYHSLGRAHYELGDYDQAETYFLESWEQGQELLDRRVQGAKTLGELYKTTGDFARALEWQEKYMALQDSLFNQEKDAQMTRMLAEFEAENKDQAIRLLTTENELRRRRNLMLGTVTGLLLVIMGLLVLFWLNNRRKSRLLASKNADLAQALAEKETLMREIHHRVKNNLQVIASLLRLQGRRLSDSEAKTAIEASQARLEAISLIHQFLYRDTEVAQVDLKAYLETLLDQLERLYESTEQELQTSHEIEAVNLDIEAVLPISLIVNELLTNAFKYAPRGNAPAQIHLGLKREAEGLRLTITDNGPGYDPANHRKDSLGLRLVQTFVDRLSGKLDIQTQAGTTVNISLPWNALAS
jgi:two-component sensor histidine kinase